MLKRTALEMPHIAAVLLHAAEQIDHEFSVLQLRILPGGERTAHASRES
jgi:hypothetical protein